MLEQSHEGPIPPQTSLNQLVKEAAAKKSALKEVGKDSTPLRQDILKETQESMKQMADPQSGGSTGTSEAQITTLEAIQTKMKLIKFLGENVGMNLQQYKDLSPELREEIEAFNPKTPEERDDGFRSILNKLKNAATLNEAQRKNLGEMEKAIVEKELLNIDDIFGALTAEIKTNSKIADEDRTDVIKNLEALHTDLKQPNAATKIKSFREKMPQIVKTVGMVGSALMLFAVWRSLKESQFIGQAA